MENNRIAFPDFISRFPQVTPPLTLGEETHHIFSVENEPLTDVMIQTYILPYEANDADEYTEYVPCFSLDVDDHFIALVWWKAALLEYEYVLAVYTLKGELISRRTIAGTKVEGERVKRIVATFTEDFDIIVGEGYSVGMNDALDPDTAVTHRWEILPDGQIA